MDLNLKNTPKRIKKKDLILDSAVSIFSQHGYHNTKLEQITIIFLVRATYLLKLLFQFSQSLIN
jgi:hypothetical protein